MEFLEEVHAADARGRRWAQSQFDMRNGSLIRMAISLASKATSWTRDQSAFDGQRSHIVRDESSRVR